MTEPSATKIRRLGAEGRRMRAAFLEELAVWRLTKKDFPFWLGSLYLYHARDTTGASRALKEMKAAHVEWLDWLAVVNEALPGERCETCHHWARNPNRAHDAPFEPILPEALGQCRELDPETALAGVVDGGVASAAPTAADQNGSAAPSITMRWWRCPKYADKRKPLLTIIDGGSSDAA